MVLKSHVDADPFTASSDRDVTVAATYTAAGQLVTLARMPPITGGQVTIVEAAIVRCLERD